MAKYWETGEVKTRLGADIGNQKAAKIHELFVRHLSEQLAEVADHRFAVVAPTSKIEPFAATLPDTWQTCGQSDGDLGKRMQDWFQRTLGNADPTTLGQTGQAKSPDPAPSSRHMIKRAILIGADCPSITTDEIHDAFETLVHHDIVLGPAIDGGYYLIGIRGPWRSALRSLFVDIPWSRDRVFSITRERIDRDGFTCDVLPTKEDIDTIAELRRLLKSLRSTSSTRTSDGRLAEAIECVL